MGHFPGNDAGRDCSAAICTAAKPACRAISQMSVRSLVLREASAWISSRRPSWPLARSINQRLRPAEFTFAIPADATRVTLAAGLQPSAYAGENQTDGFAVLVYLTQPGRTPQLLHRHFIDPRQHAADRGTQVFVVDLPDGSAPGSQLVVRSDPGPNHDDRWDWGYLQTVYFSRR